MRRGGLGGELLSASFASVGEDLSAGNGRHTERNPWRRLRTRLEGWNVRFIVTWCGVWLCCVSVRA